MSAIQVLGLSFRRSIVRSVYIASAPQQGGGVTRFTTWFEDVHSIFCHADSVPYASRYAYGNDAAAAPLCDCMSAPKRTMLPALERLPKRRFDIFASGCCGTVRGCVALGVELGLAPVRTSVGSGLSLPSACHAAVPRLVVPVGRFTETVAIRSSKNFSVTR